jgi:Fur family ferric uptake transcriptional regulator
MPIHGCPGPMHELAPVGCEVERHDLVLHGRCAACAESART